MSASQSQPRNNAISATSLAQQAHGNITNPSHSDFGTSIGAKLGLILFGIVLSLLVFEIGFRMFAPLMERTVWNDRPKKYFLPEMSQSARDYSYTVEKPANTFRIFVIGDSFSYGGAVQMFDNFSKRLERYLNLNTTQRHVEVINYSEPGTATIHQLRKVDRAIRRYNPDLILLQVTLNDPEPKPYQVTHSYQGANGQIQLTNPIFGYWKSLGYVMQRIYSTQSHHEFRQYYNDIFDNPENWFGFTNSLSLMARHCREHNVPFAAVVFPLFNYSVTDAYPFRNLHLKIDRELDQLSVPHLDLLSAYRNIPAERLQAVPGDNAHPNEIAHRIAADHIYNWLVHRHLVPEDVVVKNDPSNRVLRAPLSISRSED